ncbi:hypothetical protein EW145_g3762 [Phellinidium pouzarii]|uniref:Uncharacterized protein n=1 Tax=Phellinidium pouzarii TaxID=167371 RepID=A0A4S4L675_9AGAM|nr:hypothetical protein EW145_g3762 [Phellinidium pouzarii]
MHLSFTQDLKGLLWRSQESCIKLKISIDTFSSDITEFSNTPRAVLNNKTEDMKALTHCLFAEKKIMENIFAVSNALLEEITRLRERAFAANETRGNIKGTERLSKPSIMEAMSNAADAASTTMAVSREEKLWRRVLFSSSAALATFRHSDTSTSTSYSPLTRTNNASPMQSDLDNMADSVDTFLEITRLVLGVSNLLIEVSVLAITLPEYDLKSGAATLPILQNRIEVAHTLLPFISSALEAYVSVEAV